VEPGTKERLRKHEIVVVSKHTDSNQDEVA